MTVDLTQLVKPLEWVENPDAGEGGWLGGTASSTLVYHAMGDGWSYHRGMFWRDASTLEAAQAAANADHAARVLAALNTALIEELVGALDKARGQLRIIAGMDLMGASAVAWNAAREADATLAKLKGGA
jgi:hypothetical protein